MKATTFQYEYNGNQLRIHKDLLHSNTQSTTLSRPEDFAHAQVVACLIIGSTLSMVFLKHTSAHDDSRKGETKHRDYKDQRRPLCTSNALLQSKNRAKDLRRGHEMSSSCSLALT